MKKSFSLYIAIASLALLLLSCSPKAKADFVLDYEVGSKSGERYFQSPWLVDEDSFIDSMRSTVEPYLEERKASGELECSDGIVIHYETFRQDNDRGVVVLFHGFCEFTEKFNEQTYYFLKAGYSVVRFDHMGHGRSSRKVEGFSKVHTDDFEEYVSDANEIVRTVAVPFAGGRPLFLYAHSMGGGIGARYIEEYPEVFTRVLLTCPMVKINTGSMTEGVAYAFSKFMRLIGKGTAYIPGDRDFDQNIDVIVDDGTHAPSSSVQRKKYYSLFRHEDESYTSNGGTYGWTNESIKATRKMRSKKEASKIKVPVLLMQAENDALVKPEGHFLLRENSETVRIVLCPEVTHEIYASHNRYLYAYYDAVLKFFETGECR